MMENNNYTIIEISDNEGTFAVVKENGEIVICQENWQGNDFTKIHLTDKQILELAEKISSNC